MEKQTRKTKCSFDKRNQSTQFQDLLYSYGNQDYIVLAGGTDTTIK